MTPWEAFVANQRKLVGKEASPKLSMGRIIRMRHLGPDNTPYDLGDNPLRDEFKYSQNAAGQRTKMVETFWLDADNNASTPDVARTTTYDWIYDANNRLTQEMIDSFDDAVDRTDTFVMDLFGNRVKRTTNLASTPNVVDQVFTYLYDNNDRILSEQLDEGGNGSLDQTTSYSWSGTQQSGKTVIRGSVTETAQSFSYDLQGRMISAATSKNGSPLARVDYQYDSHGTRISARTYADANGNGQIESGELTGSTEYLIDYNNFTGYSQTIVETSKNATGQRIKQIVYTFGMDEISQTVRTYDAQTQSVTSTLQHYFGHDGHGSVRVLFEATAAIAQVFTYAAYGELLAIHNRLSQAVGTVNSQGLESTAATNLLYNGESFDSRIGQLYLRARWYDMHRFNTLDPFGGNANDPLSFNKYGFVHGNPVMGVDPSGEFLVGAFAGIAVGNYLRTNHNVALGKVWLVTAEVIFDQMLEVSRSIFWAAGLAASPVRSLTQNEQKVLKYLHENANHKYSKLDVSQVMHTVQLYNGSSLSIGDLFSIWGLFAKGAIDGWLNPPAGAVTTKEQIYFASTYNVSKEWVPDGHMPNNIALLAHETTHTLQATAANLGLYSFGPYYLWETTRYGYHESVPEIEGYAMQFAVQDLIKKYPTIVSQIVAGNPPANAAVDMAAFFQQHEAALRRQYGR